MLRKAEEASWTLPPKWGFEHVKIRPNGRIFHQAAGLGCKQGPSINEFYPKNGAQAIRPIETSESDDPWIHRTSSSLTGIAYEHILTQEFKITYEERATGCLVKQ
jgi:hypothetical protein